MFPHDDVSLRSLFAPLEHSTISWRPDGNLQVAILKAIRRVRAYYNTSLGANCQKFRSKTLGYEKPAAGSWGSLVRTGNSASKMLVMDLQSIRRHNIRMAPLPNRTAQAVQNPRNEKDDIIGLKGSSAGRGFWFSPQRRMEDDEPLGAKSIRTFAAGGYVVLGDGVRRPPIVAWRRGLSA
jgi:hypothetical protein